MIARNYTSIKSDAVSYDGRIDRSKFVYISKDVHEKFKRSQLKTDDILFSMAGVFLGKTGMVEENMLPANTNQALAIIRLNKLKAQPRFVNYFLRQSTVIDFINNMSGQSAQPNINFQEIKSIEIDLPPFEEQKAIAAGPVQP
ncbi:MAG: restriction endonuclease subunit S [Methylovulum sp.]|uniref:restriction endonuclease subunit S n=1 Tax=Methylovulum sp. TaxID=1916980 RepID=UPI00260A4EDB|nr:restriction endonuclease subunit S [Methylovulum sp.]MDD2725468.1 restriction endonuclease subunit S [Methylovulum sp.]